MKNNIIFIIALMLFSFESFAAKIDKIIILGNSRVEQKTIIDYLDTKIGDTFNDAVDKKIINNLYKTGLFNSIKVNFLNGALNITIKEKVFINKVLFEGNNKLKTDIFKPYIKTIVGKSLDESLVQKDIETLKEIYRKSGRYNAEITTNTNILKSNVAVVTFKIVEGAKTKVKYISFVGNNNYNSEILKPLITTKEARWYNFFIDQDRYDEELIENDKLLLQKFYNSMGYKDFRVVSVTNKLSPNNKYFSLFYSLDEGPRYKLGTVKINSTILGDKTEAINKLITIKNQTFFNETLANSNAYSIREFLLANGYPEILVTVKLIKSDKDRLIDVQFTIEKAEKIFIGNINIIGNVKTHDSLIRKYISLCEADLFSATAMSVARQNLNLLNYFSKVQITTSQNTKNTNALDVNIKVEEKSTMDTTFKLGYGTQSGFYGAINFAEINLFGMGKKLNLVLMRSQNGTNLGVDFINPELFGRNIRNGISGLISSNQSLPLNYTENSRNINLFAAYNIASNLSHEVKYGLKSSDVTMGINNPAPGTNNTNNSANLSNFYTSSITNEINYNKLDNPNSPKNGYNISIAQQTAGLGGDNKFLKLETNGMILKSFIKNTITLSASFNAAIITPYGGQNDIKIMDRFVLGDYTFRGFEYGGIGPCQQLSTTDKKSLGGLQYYVLTLDLKFPLGLPEEVGISGHLFVDAGSVWGVNQSDAKVGTILDSNALRASVGIGFSMTKMPIRIDLAMPLMKQPFDKGQTVSFRMG